MDKLPANGASVNINHETNTRIMRLPEVSNLVGLCATTIWRHEKAGIFPQRVQLPGQSMGWFANEIEDWLRSLPRGPIPRNSHPTG